MSLLYRTAILVVLLSAQVSAQKLSEDGRSQIDDFLDASVGTSTVPGVVAVVVTPQAVLYQKAAGYQNVAESIPMQEDSIFRIASMTKPVTSVATMQLVEEGKVRLDAPISDYLPELSNLQVALGSETTRKPTTSVTIRQLLNHTSGYGYSFSNHLLATLKREHGKEQEAMLLVHDPGSRWTYGCGTRVLGDLVNHVSELELDEYLQKRILRPLNMADTGYRVPIEKLGRLTTVHQRGKDGLIEKRNLENEDGNVVGDYGLRSTAGDYGRFLQVFLHDGIVGGAQILAPNSIEAMTTNQIGELLVHEQPGARPKLSRAFPLGAGHDKFGLGFQLTMRSDATSRSVGSYSWSGIFNTHFWVDPDRRIAAVVLMQVLPFYDENCIKLLTGFEERLYKHLK